MPKHRLHLAACAARPGLPISFYIKIDDKHVWTGGFVTKAVKTGPDEITVTIKHWKTGELHTNVLRANKSTWLNKSAMFKANPHLFATPTQCAVTTLAITNGAAYFQVAEVGTELTQESSLAPGVVPQTITFKTGE